MTEPTDKELEAFAIEEQFLLFCDVDEFTQIARAVLAKWVTPQPVVREPLTLQQIAKAFAEAGLDPDDYPDDVMIEPLVRSIERAHSITQNGGSNAERI